ncbi:MAG TPA: trigger factor [Acidimicrobiales bacterium]|nr:trigger factor [Acidimicrobiales bacterium]
MRATTHTLEGNLVRLSVEVDEPEFDKALGDVVRSLAKQARVPGFRPGKVPRKVLEARMGGANALRAEAIRESLPDFYAQAVVDTGMDPIANPEIDITSGEDGGALTFDAVVQVRPLVSIPGYDGLQVTIPAVKVSDEDIGHQVDRLRDNDAELETVGRPAQDGDLVTIDLHGTDAAGTEVVGVDDYLYEVGSGSVVPELDAELRGSSVGDILAFRAQSPGDPDQSVSFRVLTKEVKVKNLPDPTDAWASENSEFDTIEALRADIAERIGRVKVLQANMILREKAVEALAGLVSDTDVPDVLVDSEVSERLHDLQHRLEAQKTSVSDYLRATGRSPDDLLEAVRADSHRAVKADLALRALAEAVEVDVDDEELDAEVASMAERMQTSAATLRSRLDTAGRTGAVRSELRKAKALQWLLDHVELFDEEGNPVSREELSPEVAKETEESES